jgi:hypothetical protein
MQQLQARQASKSSLKYLLALYLTFTPIVLQFYSRISFIYMILPFVPMHYINNVINQVSQVRQHFFFVYFLTAYIPIIFLNLSFLPLTLS